MSSASSQILKVESSLTRWSPSGVEETQMAASPFIWNVMGQKSLKDLPGKLFRVYAKHFSKFIFHYIFAMVKDHAELEIWPKMCTKLCLQPHSMYALQNDAEQT